MAHSAWLLISEYTLARWLKFCIIKNYWFISFFHESLNGAILSWYISLDNTKIKKWRDLLDIFIKSYKLNVNIAPNCLYL